MSAPGRQQEAADGVVASGAELVGAVGGTRAVAAPDAIARDYIVLALRLDQHVPGLVDGYYGPASLKAQVDIEQLRAPARLRDDAVALRERLETEVTETDRSAWLRAQLTALEAQAAALTGDALPYEEHVRRCFDWSPAWRAEEQFDAAAAAIEDVLPGPGSVAERLAAWDERHTIDPSLVEAAAGWLIERFRERSAERFGLPEGESLTLSLVHNQPWSGYNWYEGGLRSRIDLNLDLPIRAADLVHTIAHETYPGHHLEHATKEAVLVEDSRRLEASVLLINTPECLISEGLADVGLRVVLPQGDERELLAELYVRGGVVAAADRGAARDGADRDVRLRPLRRRLAEIRVNAALLRHAHGATSDETLAYLCDVGRLPEPRARKALEFIEHPLWRTYVFVYHEGEALLERWLGAVPSAARVGRFGRVLREQLTPSVVAHEAARADDPGDGRA